MVSVIRTAQQGLRIRYPSYLRRAALAALLIHLAIFVLSPPFEFKPYAFSVVVDTTVIEDVVNPVIPAAPKKVPPPEIDATAVDDTEEDVPMPVTSPVTLSQKN